MVIYIASAMQSPRKADSPHTYQLQPGVEALWPRGSTLVSSSASHMAALASSQRDSIVKHAGLLGARNLRGSSRRDTPACRARP